MLPLDPFRGAPPPRWLAPPALFGLSQEFAVYNVSAQFAARTGQDFSYTESGALRGSDSSCGLAG